MTRLCVRITEDEIYANIPKFNNHVDFIDHKFRTEHGMKLVNKDKLFWMRGDSDSYLLFEIYGSVGENEALLPKD